MSFRLYNHSEPTKRRRKQINNNKYMGTPNPDVSLIDGGGVRTRAKTLALQNAAVSSTAGPYIQLRSRRLVKPTASKIQNKNRVPPKSNCKKPNFSGIKVDSGVKSDSVKKLGVGDEEICKQSAIRVLGFDDDDSIGENVVEIEGRGRSTRETTPCHLIRDPDTISAPGSSTKRAYCNNANYRVQTSAPSHIPLAVEMDEFFTEPEKQQQRTFIEKYNFDPVNDEPLPGRYEWVKMDATKNAN